MPSPSEMERQMEEGSHNSGDAAFTIAAGQLRGFVERIERLEEEKKGIMDDIKDVKLEAKANGYDTKTITKVIRLRAMDLQKRREEEALLETYRAALGLD